MIPILSRRISASLTVACFSSVQTISNGGPWKLGGYLPAGFASHLESLENLILDGPVNYVDETALDVPSEKLQWLLLASPFFKPNSLSSEPTEHLTLKDKIK
jgi:hypothetical protein